MEPADNQAGGKRKSRATRRKIKKGGQREHSRTGEKKRTMRRTYGLRYSSRAGRKRRRK